MEIIEGGYNGWDEEDDWIDENESEMTSMDTAKDIMSMLENDPELMDNFNFLLRQRKLKQLKENG